MGAQFLYPRIAHLQSAVINFSGSGDNIIISAVSGSRVHVHRLFIVCGGATALTFIRGSTSLSGPLSMAANGGITLDITGEPWFSTDINEAFKINSSLAVQVSGTVYYHAAKA